jgi:hypothetical protein
MKGKDQEQERYVVGVPREEEVVLVAQEGLSCLLFWPVKP